MFDPKETFANKMSPKDKVQNKTPKKPVIANREGFSRASFLYHASQSMALQNEALSRMYSKSVDSVTKKGVLKLDPSLKRTVCKGCHRVQTAGVSCAITVENAGKQSEVYQVKCKCGKMKRYPVGKNRDYVLFSEKQEHNVV